MARVLPLQGNGCGFDSHLDYHKILRLILINYLNILINTLGIIE